MQTFVDRDKDEDTVDNKEDRDKKTTAGPFRDINEDLDDEDG